MENPPSKRQQCSGAYVGSDKSFIGRGLVMLSELQNPITYLRPSNMRTIHHSSIPRRRQGGTGDCLMRKTSCLNLHRFNICAIDENGSLE